MQNNFLEKIQPFLTDREPLVQEFVVQALQDYPHTPPEWTNFIIEDLLNQNEVNSAILVWLNERNVDAKSVPHLIRLINKLPSHLKHLGMSFLFELSPTVIVEHEMDLAPYLAKEQFEFYHGLVNSTQEELITQFNEKIDQLEKQDRFNQSNYRESKFIQNELFRRGWLDENEVATILKAELKNDWFTYWGLLAVRAIGLLKLPTYIPILAELLTRDEDILLEEVAEALSHYQSDEVVKAVKPFAMQHETFIFALSVLRNTKTDYAETVLVDCYDVLDEDGKGMVIEGLTHQLSERAFPLIDDYLLQGYLYGVNDMDQVLYSFFKIMGRTHPDSESWKASRERKEQSMQEYERRGGFPKMEPIATIKVGRNDPCSCGSEKKFKKCCGKG